MTFNLDFKVTILFNVKLLEHGTKYVQRQINSKSYMIYRTTPFSITLNDPYPRFQGHSSLSPNIWETTKGTVIVAIEDE